MPWPSLLRARYAIAVTFLVIWAGAYAFDSVWYGDFWSHAAVVRELAQHPTSPGHPQLALDAPHAFFSPYAWVLGLSARITRADAIRVLATAGVVNALLWGLAVLAFCRAQFPRRGLAVAFWSLALIVFWWGDGEWFWSGFLHAGVFGYVVSYPSTFALIASLFVFSLTPRWLASSTTRGLAVTVLLAVVLLTHPVTAVFTIVGMAALAWQRLPELRARVVWIPLAVLVAVGLAARWPLYPFLDLFVTENGEFHARSRDLYDHVWTRTYPLLLGLPVVLARLRHRRRDALAWSILALLGVYGIGWTTGWYGLGRVVSPAAILVQIGLAREIVRLEENLSARRVRVAYACSAALVAWLAAKAEGPLTDIFERRPSNHTQFAVLEKTTADDVILSDLDTSWYVPAFGPRIVASEKPLYWVDDHRARREDLARFFDPAASDADRRSIVARYAVTYVLVDAKAPWTPPGWTELVAHNDALTLFRVGEPGGDGADSAILTAPNR